MARLSGKNNFKVVVKRIELPFSRDLDRELEWICSSLGFFEPIDREKTAFSVFKAVVRATESNRPVSSTQISKTVKMSRGSVINHLNNLQRSGLITRQGRLYIPRSRSMFRTIEEIQEDIERIFEKMKKTAKEIDSEFGIEIEE
ncbi:MAG: ArsR family transcriptional regulator [Candidatus ainarchaeum sp.]|nr:ArsR family transcriptional regulator [Candidatus ainarchaeum sp.]